MNCVIEGTVLKNYISFQDEKVFEVPKGITEIGERCFLGFGREKFLEEIRLPETVKVIREAAFSDLKYLKKVNIPKSVEKIEKWAFQGCESLVSIQLPNSIKEIEEYVFAFCSSLKKIDIPESVEVIRDSAFLCCNNLYEVNVLGTLKRIERDVFRGTQWLEHQFCFNDFVIINNILCATNSNTNTKILTIPNGTISLGGKSLYGVKAEEIIIPGTVKEILDAAFFLCQNIERINIPSSVEYIDSKAFGRCEKLKDVYLENPNVRIANDAFMPEAKLHLGKKMSSANHNNKITYGCTEKMEEKQFFTKVVGVTFENRQNYIKNCTTGQQLELIRDKFNPYDRNAIAIYAGNYQVGHVAKELAMKMAQKMDNGFRYDCYISAITGGGDKAYGLNIKIIELGY